MDEIQKAILLSQIQKVNSGNSNSQVEKASPNGSESFDNALKEAEGVQFSKHAEKRLQSRNIELSSTDKGKLETAMGSLQKKGAKDSLILMGKLAFVVNVPSKTVVTALSQDQMKEHVFTNIDSTMLVNE
ncbi:MAG: flagellar operon protein [Bacteriovoracaceae bacterium]|nr:flagellar operon protein [Bacteriovoracaceae bacterium]